MKHIALTLLAILSIGFASSAQDKTEKPIWRRGRYMHLGYSLSQTAAEGQMSDKAKFGVSLTKGSTYLFPRRNAWGEIVKIGFDVNWVDMSFAQYKNSDWSGMQSDNWNNIGNDGSDESDFNLNLNKMSAMIGVLGIGPNVTLAPLARTNGNARYLKVSGYFHYQPTLGAYIVANDEGSEFSYAYVHMYQLGAKIMWKSIGIGIEGHWGQGKFSPINFEDAEYSEDFNTGASKYIRKFANTRFYLYLNF